MGNNQPVAVVSGVSRGIGKATAIRLAEAGYAVAGISRTIHDPGSAKNLAALEASITSFGVDFKSITLDSADVEKHQEVIDNIMKDFGRIDLLVNNAGVAPVIRMDLLETTTESYDRVMGINLRGPLFFTQRVVNTMIGLQGEIAPYRPRIVFITSVSSVMSSVNRGEYCISKAGLSMTSQLFADRLSKAGIVVFEVRPGIILTDMTAPVKDKYDTMIAGGLIPQDRWGHPDDVAHAIAAIAAGSFDYSTGMIFEVSGGMNIRSL
jgi:3-oxoacyl-[acyl-carrier protein] reductase